MGQLKHYLNVWLLKMGRGGEWEGEGDAEIR
jgi:hypothetical protein